MRYMMLIYETESNEEMSPEALDQVIADYNAFGAEMRERNLYLAGDALHPATTATSVRVRNGETLTTDGPFAETKEQLGGFYILDCADLDEAVECAAKIPGARTGTVEVRPIVEWD